MKHGHYLKEFVTQSQSNQATFLCVSFKQDVCAPVVEPVCHATPLRRRVIDISAKIVRHGGRVVVKVTAATFEALNFEVLWQKSGAPPEYCRS
jgi:hypothetical protein